MSRDTARLELQKVPNMGLLTPRLLCLVQNETRDFLRPPYRKVRKRYRLLDHNRLFSSAIEESNMLIAPKQTQNLVHDMEIPIAMI